MKYTILEMLFSNKWQWVRRISKTLWVKDKIEGCLWVKFSDFEIEGFKIIGITFENDERYLVEDWRVK